VELKLYKHCTVVYVLHSVALGTEEEVFFTELALK
jgi:hypothetical protein